MVKVVALQGWDGSAYKDLKVESASNPNLRIAQYDGATKRGFVATGADAQSNTLNAAADISFLMGYNGTTWDRLLVEDSTDANLRVVEYDGSTKRGFLATGADGASNTINAKASQGFLYAFNGTTWDRLRVESSSQATLRVGLYQAGNIAEISNPSSDGVSANVWAQRVMSNPYLYNESNWDRNRGNTEATALASAARTASTNSSDLTNYNAKGAIITLDVTVDPGGAETLQLLVQHKDSVASSYEILLDDGANATPGRRTVIIYPGVGAAGNDVTTAVGYPLPRTWRVRVVHSAAGSWTYSVAVSYIL